MFLTWCPGSAWKQEGSPSGRRACTACASASWDGRLRALAPCPPALSRHALSCLRLACDLPQCSLLLVGSLVEEQMCWSSRFWPGWGRARPRGAKGRLGSEGRDRRWVGWGVVLLYLSWKQSPLYSFTNCGRNPILFLPICANPAPSPVPCRQVPAALGPQRRRASLCANPSWAEVGTLRCPRAPPLDPGAPSGHASLGFSERWDLGCGSSEEADGAGGGPGLRLL